jgi:hypothetical protein
MWQEKDEVVEEVLVNQSECIDVDPAVVLLVRSFTVVSRCNPSIAGRWSVTPQSVGIRQIK